MTDVPTYRTTAGTRHVERLDEEVLVYDLASDTVLRLTPDAAVVWAACDGASVTSIAASTGIAVSVVEQALTELVGHGLVVASGDDLSRRAFGSKLAIGAVAVAGAALITTLAAPSPASAQSSPGGGGGSSGGGCDTPECAGG